MKTQESDIGTWAESLEDFKPELTAVKVFSVLQFFQLKGKTTKLISENLEPMTGISYCIYDPNEKKYYLRTFYGYDLETLYFYRPNLTFSGEDISVEQLRRYVLDSNVWLLLTQDHVTQISVMLKRLWKSQLAGECKVDYRIYVDLLKSSLDYEDYKDYGKGMVGFMTVCRQYEMKIQELWNKAFNKNKL